jgi:GntR family transcriptional regulator / MocR family aminotransferase
MEAIGAERHVGVVSVDETTYFAVSLKNGAPGSSCSVRCAGVTPPTLDQIALAYFFEEASLERHLRAMRRRYRAKREVLIGALGRHLPAVRVGGTAAGLHLIAWLPDGADEHATAMAARQAGVGLHELHRHCTTMAPSPPALLLGFALPTGSELEAATKLLAASLR